MNDTERWIDLHCSSKRNGCFCFNNLMTKNTLFVDVAFNLKNLTCSFLWSSFTYGMLIMIFYRWQFIRERVWVWSMEAVTHSLHVTETRQKTQQEMEETYPLLLPCPRQTDFYLRRHAIQYNNRCVRWWQRKSRLPCKTFRDNQLFVKFGNNINVLYI